MLEIAVPIKMKSEVEILDDLDTIEETKLSSFIWLVCSAASLGGFLFGYDTGIISAVLIYLSTDLGHALSNHEKELVTSITSGGAIFGTIAAGLTADKFGRKGSIYMGCTLFIVGALLQGTAFGVAQMAMGRLIIGFGIGSAAMVIPLYLAEVSPARLRGKMIGVNTVSITAGQLISYGVGAAFGSVSYGWRWMVGLSALPAVLLACLLPFCPESPRQLVFHKKPEEAGKGLQKIFPNAKSQQIEQKVRLITVHVEMAARIQDGKSKWWMFKQLFKDPANLRATTAACGVMALSQFCGFNNLMYYSATLFAVIGFRNPVAIGSMIAAVNLIFTIFYICVVDHLGRRRVLLCTIWGMSFFLGLAATAFYYTPISADLSISVDAEVGWSAYLVLVSILGLVVFYAAGVGPLAWVSAEFFPMEVRSLGTMVLTLANWAPNALVTSIFLTQMQKMTPTGTFAFYASFCFFGWIAVYFCYPEVKGMKLENIREIFSDGFGIQKARDFQSELKKQKKNEMNAV
ncbi:Myo-inositol transporter 1 [Golovinomyces cichoracearum]|uniref:Myo-inositol transporter 1 n=1 Tax=Golovinomyces cichoracearum TaxID=62708 RepID=A0A420IWW0_9PEZI|nr:Myo-inositol transporter 1 [Golovinomyces cichoracearum]